MKKLFGIVCSIILFMAVTPGNAAYRITLRNGSEILTNRYWEERDMIRFHSRGGVAGILKNQVMKITETDDIPGAETPGAPFESNPPPESASTAPGKGDLPASAGPADNLEPYREKVISLRKDLGRAEEEYLGAITRKDKITKEAAMKKRLEASKSLIELIEEVKRKNQGKIPEAWNNL
jgi:hypothetical protein